MGVRENASCAALLGRTYLHAVTACRPRRGGGEELIYEAQPCALSRSAHTSAPAPADMAAILPEAAYRYALYTFPAIRFQLGDRLEVTDGLCVYRGRASDSFCYPTHCVTVVEISEVVPGRNSREAEEGAE